MWRGVTAVSTLRDDLTFIVSVSLRKYDIYVTRRGERVLRAGFGDE